MWIRPRSGKSLALLAALFVSLFVFVIAAGEARAEEQGGLPGTQWPQWCAAPPDAAPPGIAPPGTAPSGTAPCPPTVRPSVADTSPLDNPPAGSTANGTASAPPFPPPHDSVPLPAPGAEARLLRPPQRGTTWFAALLHTRPAARSQGCVSQSQGRAYLPPQVGGRVGREAGTLRCGPRVGAGNFSGSGLGGCAFNGALGGRTARAACPP